MFYVPKIEFKNEILEYFGSPFEIVYLQLINVQWRDLYKLTVREHMKIGRRY